MRIRLLFFFTISIFIASCEKDSYKYTPLYPTPSPDYYETVSLGTAYNGNLIVAGSFSHLFNSSYGIAQWNGSSWQGLGSGIGSKYGPGGATCFTNYNGNLYVGGDFTIAGGSQVNGIAIWNGTAWQTLPGVTGGTYAGTGVSGMTIYNGNLVIVGSFNFVGALRSVSIAQWNGSSWQNIGGQGTDTSSNYYLDSYLNCAAVYNNNLYVGGYFHSICNVAGKSLAQWNGTTWSTTGLTCNGVVNSLTTYNNTLIACGSFDTIGGIAAKGIAQWNGSSWSALNQLSNSNYAFLLPNYLNAYNNNLYYIYADGDSTLFQWNGSGPPSVATICTSTKERWTNPNSDAFMCPLCIYNGNLVVGGWFTSVNGVSCNNNLAQWNGTNWSSPF